MLGRISYRELVAIVICAIVATSCAQSPGTAATGASGSNLGGSSNIFSSSGGSTSTNSSGSSSLTIQSFSPAAGSYSALPSSVQVTFNESNLTSSVSSSSNWALTCTCGYSAVPSSVTFSGSTATVNLPSLPNSCSSPTNSCALTAGAGIRDTSGNTISGNNKVTYNLSSSSSTPLTVTGFTPATGASMPSTVTVAFSSTNLNASTVNNTANWTLTCTNGGTYSVSSVVYNYSGAATVSLPPGLLQLAGGTQCTLTATNGISDMNGQGLSQSSATYVVPGSSTGASGSSASGPTQAGSAGGTGGAPFADELAPSGNMLTGLVVGIGDDYVGNFTAEWADSTGNLTAGNLVGSSTNTKNGTFSIYCATSLGFRASGVYGNLTQGHCGSNGSQPCLQSIGLICSADKDSPYAGTGYTYTTYTEGYWGSSLGSSYKLQCPAGTFITMLYGRSGNGIDQIGIGCQ